MKLMLSLMMVFFLAFTSAITIYSGENINLELEKPFEHYSIVGNSTEVILDVIQEGNNVTIIPSKYSLNDVYEIVFFDIEEEVITVVSGGGGSQTRYRDRYVDREIDNYIDREVIINSPCENVSNNNLPIKNSNENENAVWFVIVISIVCLLTMAIIFKLRLKQLKGGDKDE